MPCAVQGAWGAALSALKQEKIRRTPQISIFIRAQNFTNIIHFKEKFYGQTTQCKYAACD